MASSALSVNFSDFSLNLEATAMHLESPASSAYYSDEASSISAHSTRSNCFTPEEADFCPSSTQWPSTPVKAQFPGIPLSPIRGNEKSARVQTNSPRCTPIREQRYCIDVTKHGTDARTIQDLEVFKKSGLAPRGGSPGAKSGCTTGLSTRTKSPGFPLIPRRTTSAFARNRPIPLIIPKRTSSKFAISTPSPPQSPVHKRSICKGTAAPLQPAFQRRPLQAAQSPTRVHPVPAHDNPTQPSLPLPLHHRELLPVISLNPIPLCAILTVWKVHLDHTYFFAKPLPIPELLASVSLIPLLSLSFQLSAFANRSTLTVSQSPHISPVLSEINGTNLPALHRRRVYDVLATWPEKWGLWGGKVIGEEDVMVRAVRAGVWTYDTATMSRGKRDGSPMSHRITKSGLDITEKIDYYSGLGARSYEDLYRTMIDEEEPPTWRKIDFEVKDALVQAIAVQKRKNKSIKRGREATTGSEVLAQASRTAQQQQQQQYQQESISSVGGASDTEIDADEVNEDEVPYRCNENQEVQPVQAMHPSSVTDETQIVEHAQTKGHRRHDSGQSYNETIYHGDAGISSNIEASITQPEPINLCGKDSLPRMIGDYEGRTNTDPNGDVDTSGDEADESSSSTITSISLSASAPSTIIPLRQHSIDHASSQTPPANEADRAPTPSFSTVDALPPTASVISCISPTPRTAQPSLAPSVPVLPALPPPSANITRNQRLRESGRQRRERLGRILRPLKVWNKDIPAAQNIITEDNVQSAADPTDGDPGLFRFWVRRDRTRNAATSRVRGWRWW